MKTIEITESMSRKIQRLNGGSLYWADDSKIKRNELCADFDLQENEDGTFSLSHKRDDFYIHDINTTLTQSEKKTIAKLAVEKSETIGNGVMHVYSNELGKFEILVNSEYRDDEHQYIISLNVWNESKPYSQAAFLRQIENANN